MYFRELNRLFYLFRLAQLNARYQAKRIDKLRSQERFSQVVIALSTASSFAVLALSPGPKGIWVGALLSVLAFLAATVTPWLGISRDLDESQGAYTAWSLTARQIESGLRFIRAQASENVDISGWTSAAEMAFDAASALHPVEKQGDEPLIAKLESDINAAFPPDYVWTAF